MSKPLDHRPLYICGEASSNSHGWIEGTVQTADMALVKFGLSPL